MKDIAKMIYNRNFMKNRIGSIPEGFLLFANRFDSIKIIGKDFSDNERLLLDTQLNGKTTYIGPKKDFFFGLTKKKFEVIFRLDCYKNSFIDELGCKNEMAITVCGIINLKQYSDIFDCIDIILSKNGSDHETQTIYL